MRVKNFHLGHTLESGQFFRYYKKDDWYYVTTGDHFFRVRQEEEILKKEGAPLRVVKRFLGLSQDYEHVLSSFEDPLIKNIQQQLHGLRLLEQNSWECLCAFICSSASNIPKITKNVNSLAQSFGVKKVLGNEVSYTFPRPGEMKDDEKIKSAGVGYRAAFLQALNKTITEDQLSQWPQLSYDALLEKLMSLHGVGEKIADCVALFAFQRFEAFPVDVWIQRIMEQHYTGPVRPWQVKGFAQSYFGRYAGYAQQFLYHDGRRKIFNSRVKLLR